MPLADWEPLTPEATSLALEQLFAKRPDVMKSGRERMFRALARADAFGGSDPFGLTVPSVLVGGTNGKGSTSGFLYQLLAASGQRVGLYTSPHLVEFCERIQVSDCYLDDGMLMSGLRALERGLGDTLCLDLSFFELTTLLALRAFRELGVDIKVLEIGLGGRLDACNAVNPSLSIITSIGRDHTEILGNTLAAIASEKAGIMRPGVPLIWAGGRDGEAASTLAAIAAGQGTPLWSLDELISVEGQQLALKVPGRARASLPLPPAWPWWPEFLRRNFSAAAAALAYLREPGAIARAGRALLAEELPSAPSLQGRFQFLHAAPLGEPPRPLLVDVCHNQDGARVLLDALRARGLGGSGAKLPAIISMFKDKDCAAVLDTLRAVVDPLVFYRQDAARSWSHADLPVRHQDVPWADNVAQAWRYATARLAPESLLLACGSVHGIGELMAFLAIKPAQSALALNANKLGGACP